MNIPKNDLNEIREEFTRILMKQDYEYRHDIVNEKTLKANLRKQLERLNSKVSGKHFRFEEVEWTQFYKEYFERGNIEGIYKKTSLIQSDTVFELKRGYGSSLGIELIHRANFQDNLFQIIDSGDNKEINNNDLTILINGFPIVHIEIKKGNISRGSFDREKFEKVWGPLFEFLQIYIISNGLETKYYSCSTKNTKDLILGSLSNESPPSKDLLHFARTLFTKQTILNILINYCDSNLKVLRPYQVDTVKKIIGKVKEEENNFSYILYASGTGKTLTAFKASKLVHTIQEVKKVLFVVNKDDLDCQTHREYKGFMDKDYSQTIDNTEKIEILEKLLNDSKKRIIITTAQKLSLLLSKRRKLYEHRVVFILDECSNIYPLIKSRFKKNNIFAFTSSPPSSEFSEILYSYNLIDAIKENNVLEFCVDFVCSKETNFQNPQRIEAIVKYIIQNFENETINNQISELGVVTRNKFSSLMTVESIPIAIKYYQEFEKQIKANNKNLRVGIIYSHDSDGELTEEEKKFLYDQIIKKYGRQFKQTIVDFEHYKESISLELKKGKIDILIVVNMFLTGIDSPTLNTIWIDRNLEDLQLIKAFSRTNRVYNEGKLYGNIVCFRDIEESMNKALIRYSGYEKNSSLHLSINTEIQKEEENFSNFEMNVIKSLEVNIKYIQNLSSKNENF